MLARQHVLQRFQDIIRLHQKRVQHVHRVNIKINMVRQVVNHVQRVSIKIHMAIVDVNHAHQVNIKIQTAIVDVNIALLVNIKAGGVEQVAIVVALEDIVVLVIHIVMLVVG